MPRKPKPRVTSKKRSRKTAAGREYDRIWDRLQRNADALDQEKFDPRQLLPPFEVIQRIVRREYETLNPTPVRAHQQLLRNFVRALAAKVNPNTTIGLSAVDDCVTDALNATEDLAVRAAFFVGMTVGFNWLTTHYEEAGAR